MAVDEQIIVAGQSASPVSYTVPNLVEIVLLAVAATFDGSAAGSAFLPAVEIVSDAGVLVARAITSETVAAGGSASVSFYPSGDAGGLVSLPFAIARISVAGAGTSTLVPAQPGKKIRVVQAALMADGFTNVSFSGGALTTGAFPLAANTGFVLGPVTADDRYWYETSSSTALSLVNSAGANVGGVVGYVLA